MSAARSAGQLSPALAPSSGGQWVRPSTECPRLRTWMGRRGRWCRGAAVSRKPPVSIPGLGRGPGTEPARWMRPGHWTWWVRSAASLTVGVRGARFVGRFSRSSSARGRAILPPASAIPNWILKVRVRSSTATSNRCAYKEDDAAARQAPPRLTGARTAPDRSPVALLRAVPPPPAAVRASPRRTRRRRRGRSRGRGRRGLRCRGPGPAAPRRGSARQTWRSSATNVSAVSRACYWLAARKSSRISVNRAGCSSAG